jgi:hypothetical protein
MRWQLHQIVTVGLAYPLPPAVTVTDEIAPATISAVAVANVVLVPAITTVAFVYPEPPFRTLIDRTMPPATYNSKTAFVPSPVILAVGHGYRVPPFDTVIRRIAPFDVVTIAFAPVPLPITPRRGAAE